MIQEQVSCSDRLSEASVMRHLGGNRQDAWAYLNMLEKIGRMKTDDGLRLGLQNINQVSHLLTDDWHQEETQRHSRMLLRNHILTIH